MSLAQDEPRNPWAPRTVAGLRIFSLIGALLLWTAWSEVMFFLILGLAFCAYGIAALIARFVPGGNAGFSRICPPNET